MELFINEQIMQESPNACTWFRQAFVRKIRMLVLKISSTCKNSYSVSNKETLFRDIQTFICQSLLNVQDNTTTN